MKTPIEVEYQLEFYGPDRVVFVDSDNKYYEPEDVCDAINNAAAGPWKRRPAPDGKVDGEMMLFSYACTVYDDICIGYWSAEKGDWYDRKNGCGSWMRAGHYSYAHLRSSQPE